MAEFKDTPARIETGAERVELWSARLLNGPLTLAVLFLALIQLATWAPHYLTWPWWADHDVFATLALGWDAGLGPYRDLRGNNFPGTVYIFWAIGKLFGWGRTAPFYAFDATLVAGLGAALVVWSKRRFGRMLPGAIGYLSFLAYYLSLDYTQAAQRDWHAPFFAVCGLFAAEAFRGRMGRWSAALGVALALSIRPQAVLFLPAALLAIRDEQGHLSGRALSEFVIALIAFLAALFAPLVAAGVLGDFLRGVRAAGFGGSYYRNTITRFGVELFKQFTMRDLAVLTGMVLLYSWASRSTKHIAQTWIAAWLCVTLYKPLSPYPHAYLDHPRTLVSAVLLAILVELLLTVPVAASYRLASVLLALGLSAVIKPVFSNPVMSRLALGSLMRGEDPIVQPMGYRHNLAVLLSAEYPWDDLRAVTAYLRNEIPRSTRVANVLQGVPALTGPTAHLPALPAESIAWLFMVQRDDEAAFATKLEETPDSVVVWSPRELGFNPRFGRSFDLPFLEPVIRRHYEPDRQFGTIEVWRRKPADERPSRSRGD